MENLASVYFSDDEEDDVYFTTAGKNSIISQFYPGNPNHQDSIYQDIDSRYQMRYVSKVPSVGVRSLLLCVSGVVNWRAPSLLLADVETLLCQQTHPMVEPRLPAPPCIAGLAKLEGRIPEFFHSFCGFFRRSFGTCGPHSLCYRANPCSEGTNG